MKDFRRRNLIVLGIAATLSIVLSAAVLIVRAGQSAVHFTPTTVLPGFAAQVNSARRIHILTHAASFDVVYLPGKGWVLPGKGNYPADFEVVRHTLIGLAALETIAPKTGRPDWLTYIGLDTPPQGSGNEITVSDGQNHVLATLITGNNETLSDAGGASGLFVRRPGDTQSYLARAVYLPQTDLADWLTQGVLTINPSRLLRVSVTPASGAAFVVSREHQSDQNYVLEGAPKDGFDQQAVNAVADAITGFSIADVRPAAQVDFSKPTRVTAKTFDGVTVNLDLVSLADGVWARVSAQSDPGSVTGVRQEAEGITTRAAPWAYKLPQDKGQALMAARTAFLTTPPMPPMAMPPAGGGHG